MVYSADGVRLKRGPVRILKENIKLWISGAFSCAVLDSCTDTSRSLLLKSTLAGWNPEKESLFLATARFSKSLTNIPTLQVVYADVLSDSSEESVSDRLFFSTFSRFY